jgi:hypothetical protein
MKKIVQINNYARFSNPNIIVIHCENEKDYIILTLVIDTLDKSRRVWKLSKILEKMKIEYEYKVCDSNDYFSILDEYKGIIGISEIKERLGEKIYDLILDI